MRRHATADLSGLRGRRILIALSGGADSVALAAMLAEARSALGLELFAAHMDHAIRPESAGDAAFCRDLCRRLAIPFHETRVDVPGEARRTGEGLETCARRLRYRWLRAVKAEVGADVIALAHHLDDQAETVLMHLARGTGPEGIGGMRAQSGDLVRPLLGLRKAELIDFLNARGLSWREDATNALADTPRNALRLHGIPALEQSYPRFALAAARYAEAAQIESDYLAEQTDAFLAERHISGPFGDFLGLTPPPHPAILRRALRRFCPAGTDWEKLRELETLCAATHGKLEICGSLAAERGHRGLYFLPKRPASTEEIPLRLNGATALEELCTVTAADAPPVPVADDAMTQVLDADALSGAVLRTRRDGDVIRPLGCGEKLLSDYFTDRKVDRPLRDHVALVARGREILWACGLGIAEGAKLTESTRRAIRLSGQYSFDISMLY